jgi:ADP-heptose:LPS heptosyltransferase
MSRAGLRVAIVASALVRWSFRKRPPPTQPQRILVVHQLLLGDALMATALLAQLRGHFPTACIHFTVRRAFLPLYAGRPFGVDALAYDATDVDAVRALIRQARQQGGYDVAYVLGDNRYSWLARALDAKVIVAHAEDTPPRKSWPVDRAVPYPLVPTAWGDITAQMVAQSLPKRFRPSDWQAPPRPAHLALPTIPYALLHVGASTPLKAWPADRWANLAKALVDRGVTPIWSAGPGEQHWVDAIPDASRYASVAGQVSLGELWHWLASARLLVCPDTGIAHLGRIVGTPTVALFGPGSATASGPGDFFALASFRAVTVPNFPCRDQTVLFRREREWIRRCGRSHGKGRQQCTAPRCMQAIEFPTVLAAVEHALKDLHS